MQTLPLSHGDRETVSEKPSAQMYPPREKEEKTIDIEQWLK